ncbi:4'-phosphopantetheinyl transferase family protein [Bacillus cytotoxicus]|uniref:4-phosphopantetheinyl transferase sfp n=1 Tax=Bacillus cytotoxicus TaxID=580165 RepID=A0AAX2CL20_9BACI|nr:MULTISPECIES: 4'-phosphopantetheinyl transferase superfamily protein [Bacillus cereus group]MDH2888109.1 4'-phosphopantetheinyl transferase superfamily protein [Bacillus cytotoxicus]QTR70461.1 4'-phosphopantetheinyl transferase superfamily protein [Bacillus cytotoxicus]QTR84660.1 4'-phosphopantetheinyl transferase superfamily protein [Bacillus cytotoxicus]QTR88463.1 4'-phosphopantetheinyl transferase superfamily protein [Bacillus cytotoxicus]SCM02018.1 4-phosphopantetheinyl transferase sfp 
MKLSKLIAVQLTEDVPMIDLEIILSFVSQQKRSKLKQYRNMKDVRRSLVAELIIRLEVLKQVEMNNDEIIFLNNAYGKPFLQGLDFFHFNISHAGEWVVCAFDGMSIGVDIEKVERIDLDIAKHVFSKKEYENLMLQNEQKQLECFFEYWTAKESYIKAIGKGLSIPLNSFTIDFERASIIAEETESKDWMLKSYELDLQYKVTLCTKNASFPEDIMIREEKQVYDEVLSYVMNRITK